MWPPPDMAMIFTVVPLGHKEIRYHHLDGLCGQHLRGLDPVLRGHNAVPRRLKHQAQELPDPGFIIND